jgi:hypothetical protein
VLDELTQVGQPLQFLFRQPLAGVAVAVQCAGGFPDVGREVGELDRALFERPPDYLPTIHADPLRNLRRGSADIPPMPVFELCNARVAVAQ